MVSIRENYQKSLRYSPNETSNAMEINRYAFIFCHDRHFDFINRLFSCAIALFELWSFQTKYFWEGKKFLILLTNIRQERSSFRVPRYSHAYKLLKKTDLVLATAKYQVTIQLKRMQWGNLFVWFCLTNLFHNWRLSIHWGKPCFRVHRMYNGQIDRCAADKMSYTWY